MGAAGGGGQVNQVFHEDEANHVVERVLVDGDAGILLVAEERLQLAHGGRGGHGDDVGARGHDLAHHGFAEVDQRAQHLAGLAFLQRLGLAGIGDDHRVRAGRVHRRVAVAMRGTAARAPDPEERGRQGRQHAADRIERRQQQAQDVLGVAPHEQQRHELFGDQQEAQDGDEQHGSPGGTDAGDAGHEDGRGDGHHAFQQSGRHEEALGMVEIPGQPVVASAALGHDAQAELHQGAEGRGDGADVDRRQRQQEQQEGCHTRGLAPRAMSPDGRPPLRRSRASTRAICPSSVSWS
jgi:hypothetical protein